MFLQSGQSILKNTLKSLFSTLLPDVLVAWSTFENVDSGVDNYLMEEIPLKPVGDNLLEFQNKADAFVPSTAVLTRDVSAAIRDAELRLSQFKDVGGSILYIITSTVSVTNDTVVETELAERLLLNNIKLVVAESGPDATTKALSRFSMLSQGSYYYQDSWRTTGFFLQINREIDALTRNGLSRQRRLVTSFGACLTIRPLKYVF